MTDLLVYVADLRAASARTLLASACASTGLTARMEVLGTGALYQRLSQRPVPPPPDLVWWFGPFAARAALSDGLVQSASALEYSQVGLMGASSVSAWSDLAGVARLALTDPERSEVGMAILLASLDRARQVEGDVEHGWAQWQQTRLMLVESEAEVASLVASGAVSDGLTLSGGVPVPDLAALPHHAAIAANSRNIDAARRLLEWLVAQASAPAAPALDLDWCTQNYVVARQRWAQSRFAPTL
jgi:hypothetical protein